MSDLKWKKFENLIYKQLSSIPNISIDRIKNNMGGLSGVNNISDFTLYFNPYFYYIECKAIHGKTLNYKSHIRPNQWEGLTEKSKLNGVITGVLVWFIDFDITVFVPMTVLNYKRNLGFKSLNVQDLSLISVDGERIIWLQGKKKRVFMEYDMQNFLEQLTKYSDFKWRDNSWESI